MNPPPLTPLQQRNKRLSTVIIGASPAALSTACLLAEGGAEVTVLETQPDDISGRSKSAECGAISGDDLFRPRLAARLFYRGKFFSYPLKAFEAL